MNIFPKELEEDFNLIFNPDKIDEQAQTFKRNITQLQKADDDLLGNVLEEGFDDEN